MSLRVFVLASFIHGLKCIDRVIYISYPNHFITNHYNDPQIENFSTLPHLPSPHHLTSLPPHTSRIIAPAPSPPFNPNFPGLLSIHPAPGTPPPSFKQSASSLQHPSHRSFYCIDAQHIDAQPDLSAVREPAAGPQMDMCSQM